MAMSDIVFPSISMHTETRSGSVSSEEAAVTTCATVSCQSAPLTTPETSGIGGADG